MRRAVLKGFAASLIAGCAGSAAAADKVTPAAECRGKTTPEINDCLMQQQERAQANLDKYVGAAIQRYANDQPAVRSGIRASEKAFEAYRDGECLTMYEAWKDGTIRVAMQVGCLIELTDQRTHTVWTNWLRYADSTPPILPEPEPTN